MWKEAFGISQNSEYNDKIVCEIPSQNVGGHSVLENQWDSVMGMMCISLLFTKQSLFYYRAVPRRLPMKKTEMTLVLL